MNYRVPEICALARSRSPYIKSTRTLAMEASDLGREFLLVMGKGLMNFKSPWYKPLFFLGLEQQRL
jgi:hypothetical protein